MIKPHKLITAIVLILVGSTLLYTQRAVKAARRAGRGGGTRVSRMTSPRRSGRSVGRARVGKRSIRTGRGARVRRSRGVRLQPYPLRGTHYPYRRGYRRRFWYRRPYGYYHHRYPYSYSSYIYDDNYPHRYEDKK